MFKSHIPTSVKMAAAAASLLLAIFHFSSFVYFVSTMPIAWFALVKMLFAIAGAIGLLKLSPGWRVFTVFISWLCVVFLPFYILATILSPEAFLNLFGVNGIVSPAMLLSMEVFGFALFLFVLTCLTRPNARRAFQSTEQQLGEQPTVAT